MLNFIEGDLLQAKEKYIAHQCNCVTNRGAHLAKAVFDRFPHADIYSGRTIASTPGTIDIKGDGKSKRFVINMLGQYYPGSPKDPNSTLDGSKARENYFHKCLLKIYHMEDLESIAFPYRVGCGAAGGYWNNYLGTLENFSRYMWSENRNVDVTIYCLTKQDLELANLEYKELIPKMIMQDIGIK